MHRTVRYILFFVAIVLIQVCFVSRLNISVFVQPLIYSAFIILIPMDLSRMQTLLVGAVMGVVIDVLSGVPGLNTIATTAMAYVRPLLLGFVVGYDELRDGGVPSIKRLGLNKFMLLSAYLSLIHSMIFFLVETMSPAMVPYSLLRAVVSTIICMVAMYIIDMIFNRGYTN